MCIPMNTQDCIPAYLQVAVASWIIDDDMHTHHLTSLHLQGERAQLNSADIKGMSDRVNTYILWALVYSMTSAPHKCVHVRQTRCWVNQVLGKPGVG